MLEGHLRPSAAGVALHCILLLPISCSTTYLSRVARGMGLTMPTLSIPKATQLGASILQSGVLHACSRLKNSWRWRVQICVADSKRLFVIMSVQPYFR